LLLLLHLYALLGLTLVLLAGLVLEVLLHVVLSDLRGEDVLVILSDFSLLCFLLLNELMRHLSPHSFLLVLFSLHVILPFLAGDVNGGQVLVVDLALLHQGLSLPVSVPLSVHVEGVVDELVAQRVFSHCAPAVHASDIFMGTPWLGNRLVSIGARKQNLGSVLPERKGVPNSS
jgi:hypothetical protein